MEKASRLSLEALFDGVLVALGSAIAVVSWGYGFGSLARPGPGLYPFFVGLAIAGFACLALVAALRQPPGERLLDRAAARKLGLMLATFCLWVLAMPLAGYVAVTLAATFAFAKIMQLEGWVQPLMLAAGTALFIYGLFDHWLYIDLPRGMWS